MTVTNVALKAELESDPKRLGYTGKDSSAQAFLLNETGLSGEVVPVTNVTAAQAVHCVLLADWRAISQADRDYISALAAIGALNPNDLTVAANLQTMFANTQTLANFGALMFRSASRAEALWGAGTIIDSADIARALAG